MSEPIQSISQGNYILATQQEVSHDNTLSGNGTVDSPLGLNETVLFDNSGNIGKANISAYTLSESVNNFDRVRISFTRGQSFYGDQCFEYNVNSYPKIASLDCFDPSGPSAFCYFCSFTISGNSFTEVNGKCGFRQVLGGNITTTNNNWLHPYKIVGINRLSASN